MRYCQQGFAVLCLALGTSGAPTSNLLSPRASKEAVDIPPGWSHDGFPPPEYPLKISISLKQGNMNGLITKLNDLADPKSTNFRQWLTVEQVQEYTAPSEDSMNAVKSWLFLEGIDLSEITMPSVDVMQVTIPTCKAESLFQTTYGLYTHTTSDVPVARALNYTLPASLHQHIDTVQPTTAFVYQPPPHVANQTEAPPKTNDRKRGATCDPSNLTPSCLATEYDIDWTPSNRFGAQVATAGLGSTPASHSDAQLYSEYYGNNGATFEDVTVGDASNSGTATYEGNLDTQLSAAIASPNKAFYISVGTANSDAYTDLIGYLTSGNSPRAVSISYVGNEDGYSSDYLTRICNGFAQASSMGVTVLAASGDWGVSGINDPSQGCSSFIPTFPASCPYVLAVGGSDFVGTESFAALSEQDPGEAAAWFGSAGGTGGGFSNFFSMPGWQQSQVKGYISALNGQYNGLYNANGRAYPDVSSISEYWPIAVNGSFVQLYGTSASAPSWAAMISVINDYLLSEGKSTLGWYNPTLYSMNYGAFTDVIKDGSRGCAGSGFPALTGWDAATGLGVPRFPYVRVLS